MVRTEPSREDCRDLTRPLYDYWRGGIFRGFTDDALRKSEMHACRFSEGMILVRFFNAEQLMWVDARRTFNILALLGDHNSGEVQEAIQTRLSEIDAKRRTGYNSFFSNYNINEGNISRISSSLPLEVVEDPINYRVAEIKAEIRIENFHHRLLRSFGEHAYNVFSLPAMCVSWNQPVRGKKWVEF